MTYNVSSGMLNTYATYAFVVKMYDITAFGSCLQGTYNLPPSALYIDDSILPSFLADGDYHVTGVVSKGSTDVACIYLSLAIAWFVNLVPCYYIFEFIRCIFLVCKYI